MKRSIFIDFTKYNHDILGYIAIQENEKLVEFFPCRKTTENCTGNVYVGKVTDVLPGMNAAFVDVGLEKNAYLSEEHLRNGLYINNPKDEGTRLKEGREIIVQAVREPVGEKGAKVTMDITVPGRYSVLVPYQNDISVSQKIKSEEDRSRLRKIAASIKPDNQGIIMRTSSGTAEEKQIESDIRSLIDLWRAVEDKTKSGHVPRCIYDDASVLRRVVRELVGEETEKVYVCPQHVYEEVYDMIKIICPENKGKAVLYSKDYDMFDFFELSTDIRHSQERKVWFKSGGYAVFDKTEALTVIDVNSGKYIGKKDSESTIINTNREAAVEIARQLRLRNIGGIIIIDFIDMEEAQSRAEILLILKEELKNDRVQCSVLGFTSLGLVEMTRTRKSAV